MCENSKKAEFHTVKVLSPSFTAEKAKTGTFFVISLSCLFDENQGRTEIQKFYAVILSIWLLA